MDSKYYIDLLRQTKVFDEKELIGNITRSFQVIKKNDRSEIDQYFHINHGQAKFKHQNESDRFKQQFFNYIEHCENFVYCDATETAYTIIKHSRENIHLFIHRKTSEITIEMVESRVIELQDQQDASKIIAELNEKNGLLLSLNDKLHIVCKYTIYDNQYSDLYTILYEMDLILGECSRKIEENKNKEKKANDSFRNARNL